MVLHAVVLHFDNSMQPLKLDSALYLCLQNLQFFSVLLACLGKSSDLLADLKIESSRLAASNIL
jgi:hypothetical protein